MLDKTCIHIYIILKNSLNNLYNNVFKLAVRIVIRKIGIVRNVVQIIGLYTDS